MQPATRCGWQVVQRRLANQIVCDPDAAAGLKCEAPSDQLAGGMANPFQLPPEHLPHLSGWEGAPADRECGEQGSGVVAQRAQPLTDDARGIGRFPGLSERHKPER